VDLPLKVPFIGPLSLVEKSKKPKDGRPPFSTID
jgi:hypothetical protein